MEHKFSAALCVALGIGFPHANAQDRHPNTGVWVEVKAHSKPETDELSKTCNLAPWVMHENGILMVYARSALDQPMKVTFLASCALGENGIEECVPIDQKTGLPNLSWDRLFGFYKRISPDLAEYCPINAETKKVDGECIMAHRCDPEFFSDDPKSGRVSANILLPAPVGAGSKLD